MVVHAFDTRTGEAGPGVQDQSVWSWNLVYMNDGDGALHGDREVRKMSTSENYLRVGRDLWRMTWLPGRVSGWTEKSESWES